MTVDLVKFKAEWVAALRSGKFMQAHGVLEGRPDFLYDGTEVGYDDNGEMIGAGDTDMGYCCLGVGIIVGGASHIADHQSSEEEMPDDDWLEDHGLFKYVADALAKMNDAGGKSFLDIADHIERNVTLEVY